MNTALHKALRIFLLLPAIGFVVAGLRFAVAPEGAAQGLAMPLLDGAARSSQIGDVGAFCMGMGLMMLTALTTLKREWFIAPAIRPPVLGESREPAAFSLEHRIDPAGHSERTSQLAARLSQEHRDPPRRGRYGFLRLVQDEARPGRRRSHLPLPTGSGHDRHDTRFADVGGTTSSGEGIGRGCIARPWRPHDQCGFDLVLGATLCR